MSREYSVAIAGATGAVGIEMIKTLEKRNFPVKRLKLLASARAPGRKLTFKGEQLPVEVLGHDSFKGVEVALFSAGGSRSKEFAPSAVKAGTVVIDNSSAFRMKDDVPLVVPEVNPEDIKWHHGIIANPNCTTIIMLVAIKPLYDLSRIRRVVVATYQSASGAGALAMEELRIQAGQYLRGEPLTKQVFTHQIAFNLFSHNSTVGPNGYCEEEMKMVNETRKMLHDSEIKVSPTCVRVAVFRAHSEAIVIEQDRKVSVAEALTALRKAPGVRMVDDRVANHFPMPVEMSGEDDVAVGRVRDDLMFENGLALFCSGDQLLKGAALNAVQIAELL